MHAVHEEPVEVACRGDSPELFLLHDRLFVVRAVLARWVEPGGWRWSGPGRSAPVVIGGRSAEAGPPVIHSVPVDIADRQLWRVQAAAGRDARLEVFDLCHDVSGDRPRWTAMLVKE